MKTKAEIEAEIKRVQDWAKSDECVEQWEVEHALSWTKALQWVLGGSEK